MVENHENWMSGPQEFQKIYLWNYTQKFGCPAFQE